VRQPEVAGPLAALLLALVLVAPVASGLASLVLVGAFLAEFLSDGTIPVLTALTVDARPVPAPPGSNRYVGAAAGATVPLVLVHGLAPDGKDEPRVVSAARLLARAGFEVTVPTIPGLTRGRLRPDDAAPVIDALASRPGPWAMLSVSIGAAPALSAAADPRVAGRVGVVLALGPFASATETVRFWLTGEFAYDGVRGRVGHDLALVRAFVDANADLVDAPLRAALSAGAPDAVERALAALPAPTRDLLDRLSPERALPSVRARAILVHGYGDPTVPYTESLRLAAARPAGTTVILVHGIGHVERARASAWTLAAEVLRLWMALHSLRHPA
jgi:pimeloyl-ACP methyl ester carboxylesterase